MKRQSILALLVLIAAVTACGGDDAERNAAGQSYQVVAEGSASGTDPSLTSGVPPLTNTNADTTTAFSSVPGTDMTSTAMAPLPPVVGVPSTYPGGFGQSGWSTPPAGTYGSAPAPRREPSVQISRSNPTSRPTSGSQPRPAYPSEQQPGGVVSPNAPQPQPQPGTTTQPPAQPSQPAETQRDDAEAEADDDADPAAPPPPPAPPTSTTATNTAGTTPEDN